MTSEEDMKRELRERFKLAKLTKEIIGKPMTKEQKKFLNELRKKVKAKEMTVEQARKEWNRKYKVWPSSSDNPNGLQNCLDVRVTEDENIEIRFKDIPTCEAVKEDYRKVLHVALMGGETIYKTLGQHSSNPKFWTVIHNGTHDRYYIKEDALARAKELEEKYAPAIRVSVFEYTPDFTEPTGYKMEKIYPSG